MKFTEWNGSKPKWNANILLKSGYWKQTHSMAFILSGNLKRANRIMNTARAVLLWWRVWLVHRPHSPIDCELRARSRFQHKHWQRVRLASKNWEARAFIPDLHERKMHWKQLLIAQFICEKKKKKNKNPNAIESNRMASTRHINGLELQKTAPITTNRTGINVISYY